MAGLDVRLLGEVSIRLDGEAVRLRSAKSLELLGLLVARRHRPVPRDAAAEALWPEEQPEATRRQLRQALWRLNGALRPRPFVRPTRSGALQLDVAAFAAIDLVALEEAHAATADLAGADLSDRQAARLEAAVAGYGGDFLAGCSQQWCLPERARARELHLAARDQLIGWCEARGLAGRALGHGRVVLDADPARETTHRLLMRLHHRRGDRAAALRQYRSCVDALGEEYGVGPSAPTVLLHRRIRADEDGDRDGPPPAEPRPAAGQAAEIAALHERLAEIQATLDLVLRAVGPVAAGGPAHPAGHAATAPRRPGHPQLRGGR